MVTRDQALAWRLRRQFLVPRQDVSADEVVSRLCGVQAQVASAAEMTVALRQAEPKADDVRLGLSGRSLVKTCAMHGPLHLLRSSEAGCYLSLMASARIWMTPAWHRAFGATTEDMAALTETVSSLLDGAVLTRDELVAGILADTGLAGLETQLRPGWGTLLKPLAWQGALCHSASQGSNVTFTGPASMIPGWRGWPEPDEPRRSPSRRISALTARRRRPGCWAVGTGRPRNHRAGHRHRCRRAGTVRPRFGAE